MHAVIKDGDVAAALNYLKVKSYADRMLFAEYFINSDGRLKSLFRAGNTSRSNYFYFGDVVAFDATYQKNKYNFSLVIFSWCNHHSHTVIYSVALVSDKTTETYKSLLRCFLECMEKTSNHSGNR